MIPENPLRREVCAFKLQMQEPASADSQGVIFSITR
jgi:hypothetical protein